jgi:predicted Zn-dependent protease
MAIFSLFGYLASRLLRITGGVGIAAVLAIPASGIEPKVTRAAYNLFSDQEEQSLGKKFAADTDKRVVALRVPALINYLETIVKKLGTQTQRPQLVYHVSIVDSPQINAFSQPAGYIYVYRGLLDFAWDESELAGMLAHEISHVVARHNMNRLSRYEVAQELAKRSRAQGPKLQLTPAEVSAWEGGFSRSEETEADLLGFYTMLRAGWDPAGLVSAFEGIRAFTGEPDLVSEILTTHPASAERSRYLSMELQVAGPPDNLRHDSDAFQVMKRLLKALPPPHGK